MDLYEYQARDLFERHGVPVLVGEMAETPSEARAAAERIGGSIVVKAQVKTNGRGKAGGIKVAASPSEAEAVAAQILGMSIKGHLVRRVMVTPAVVIAQEYYFSLLLDRSTGGCLALCSAAGGMEIDRFAAEHPESVARIEVDPRIGIDDAKAREIVKAAKVDPAVAGKVADALVRLGRVYLKEEAILVEVNPLVRTDRGEIVALDGKVTLDDNARFRHPDHAALVDATTTDPLELRAQEKHLNYVKLDGQVGIIGNGAGLVMSTLDAVARAGERQGIRPANFLDIGGGASAEVMASGLDIILADPQVRAVFVNVFGGITSCVEVAKGILAGLDFLGAAAAKSIVVRLDGNAVDEGRRILADAAHPLVTQVDTMDEAASRVAELAAAGGVGGS